MMELVVIEKSKKRIIFELKGTDHTFCAALKKELYEDEDVKNAAYAIAHPLIGIPKFIVETSGEEPEKALMGAVKRLQKKNETVQEAFKKVRA